MTQISKKPLDKGIEKQIFDQFWISLSKVNNAQESSDFFSDLLTETEKLMLAKRFTVAILIIRGRSPTQIRNIIHVSFATIGSVASWVKNAKPKTKEILSSISQEKNWETILDKIEEVFDKLPPVYGRNWSSVGKEKWERTKKRSTRMVLR